MPLGFSMKKYWKNTNVMYFDETGHGYWISLKEIFSSTTRDVVIYMNRYYLLSWKESCNIQLYIMQTNLWTKEKLSPYSTYYAVIIVIRLLLVCWMLRPRYVLVCQNLAIPPPMAVAGFLFREPKHEIFGLNNATTANSNKAMKNRIIKSKVYGKPLWKLSSRYWM